MKKLLFHFLSEEHLFQQFFLSKRMMQIETVYRKTDDFVKKFLVSFQTELNGI